MSAREFKRKPRRGTTFFATGREKDACDRTCYGGASDCGEHMNGNNVQSSTLAALGAVGCSAARSVVTADGGLRPVRARGGRHLLLTESRHL